MAALEEIIKNRDLKGLQVYLRKNPRIPDVDPGSLSPLLLAAYNRFEEAVPLIAHGMESLTLYEACVAGNLPWVRKHVEHNPALVNHYATDGFTPLGLAGFFGKYEIAAYLLEKGAEVNRASANDFH